MFKYLLGFVLVIASTPVLASTCGNRDALVRSLQAKYNEELAVGGLQRRFDTQAVMEVWASEATGTYTVLLTQPNGISCIVAAGTDFFTVAPGAGEPEGTAG